MLCATAESGIVGFGRVKGATLLGGVLLAAGIASAQPLRTEVANGAESPPPTEHRVIWTKAMQAMVVKEAESQLMVAEAARDLMREGKGRTSVETPLLEAMERWRNLPASDLMKAHFWGCSEFASDTLGIAQEARAGRGDGPLAEKRRKFAKEEHAACLEALKNPRATFLEVKELHPHVVVE